jgi:pyruvate,water dikinase
VVGGELNPDHYAVDKVSLEIRSRTAVHKPFADRLAPATGTVARLPLPDDEAGALSLRDPEVIRLAEIGKEIERALGGPVDVEWAMGPGPEGPRHLYLLQARPETVWSRRQPAPVAQANTSALERMVSAMLPSGLRKEEGPKA